VAASDLSPYQLCDEEAAIIHERLAAADRGGFATDEEVAAMWRRFGRREDRLSIAADVVQPMEVRLRDERSLPRSLILFVRGDGVTVQAGEEETIQLRRGFFRNAERDWAGT
jgi:hypothetical protein